MGYSQLISPSLAGSLAHLERAQRGEQESPVLGQKLERDRRINRDIPAHSKTKETVHRADRGPIRRRCMSERTRANHGSCRPTGKEEPKDRGDQARQIETPLSAHDIDEDAPSERASGETDVECGGEITDLSVWSLAAVPTFIANDRARSEMRVNSLPGTPSSCWIAVPTRPPACAQHRSRKYLESTTMIVERSIWLTQNRT